MRFVISSSLFLLLLIFQAKKKQQQIEKAKTAALSPATGESKLPSPTPLSMSVVKTTPVTPSPTSSMTTMNAKSVKDMGIATNIATSIQKSVSVTKEKSPVDVLNKKKKENASLGKDQMEIEGKPPDAKASTEGGTKERKKKDKSTMTPEERQERKMRKREKRERKREKREAKKKRRAEAAAASLKYSLSRFFPIVNFSSGNAPGSSTTPRPIAVATSSPPQSMPFPSTADPSFLAGRRQMPVDQTNPLFRARAQLSQYQVPLLLLVPSLLLTISMVDLPPFSLLPCHHLRLLLSS